MIQIIDKQYCSGCYACFQICPKQCIKMEEDNEGFIYPTVNLDLCINCSLCEKVCPVINSEIICNKRKVFATHNTNKNIRSNSSSGGIFSMIAENVIQNNGVVFGAMFDKNWDVKHDYVQSIADLDHLRRSKYVQSRIDNSFIKCKEFLDNNKLILFSGTPCQISGLRRYLRKEYDNLLTIDIVCHGVPSPNVWKKYLDSFCIQNNISKHKNQDTNYIEEINFRDKEKGWRQYSLRFNIRDPHNNTGYSISQVHYKNPYMLAFLKDIILRPSCYMCKTRIGYSGADITLGDYWNINNVNPKVDDNKGISLIITNNQKGFDIIKNIDINLIETTFEETKACLGGSNQKKYKSKKREYFFNNYTNSRTFEQLLIKVTKKSLLKRITRNLNKTFRLDIILSIVKSKAGK